MQQPHLGALFVTLCLIFLSPEQAAALVDCYQCGSASDASTTCAAGGFDDTPSDVGANGGAQLTSGTPCSYCAASYDGTHNVLLCGAAGATCPVGLAFTCSTVGSSNNAYATQTPVLISCYTCTDCATTTNSGTTTAGSTCYACMTEVAANSITKTCLDGIGSDPGTNIATTCTASATVECCIDSNLCNGVTHLTTTTVAPAGTTAAAGGTTAAAGGTTAAAGGTTAAAGATTTAAGATTASTNCTSSTTHSSSSKTLPISAGIMFIMSLIMIAMINN